MPTCWRRLPDNAIKTRGARLLAQSSQEPRVQMCPGQGFLNGLSPNVALSQLMLRAQSLVSHLTPGRFLQKKGPAISLSQPQRAESVPKQFPWVSEPLLRPWHSYFCLKCISKSRKRRLRFQKSFLFLKRASEHDYSYTWMVFVVPRYILAM